MGQLYYHWYIKTSDTKLLFKSFSFYEALLERKYFDILFEDAVLSGTQIDYGERLAQKFRFYARFVVVCLCTRNLSFCLKLTKEMEGDLKLNMSEFKGKELLVTWERFLSATRVFLEEETSIKFQPDLQQPYSFRLKLKTSKHNDARPYLQEAILVSNSDRQVKVSSDLTLDLYRMLQSCERDEDSRQPANFPLKNPHKYLLCNPTFDVFFLFLASSYKAMEIAKSEGNVANAILLIYISSLVFTVASPSRPAQILICGKNTQTGPHTAIQQDDIRPYTRKPLALIVDSPGAFSVFNGFKSCFGQPLLVIMAPETQSDMGYGKGSQLTYFLYAPIHAFCILCSVTSVSSAAWKQGEHILTEINLHAEMLLRKEGDPQFGT